MCIPVRILLVDKIVDIEILWLRIIIFFMSHVLLLFWYTNIQERMVSNVQRVLKLTLYGKSFKSWFSKMQKINVVTLL